MSKITSRGGLTSTPTSIDLKSLLPPRVSAVVELPSKGQFYDPAVLVDGKIEIMPLVARDEKLIAGMRGDNIEEVIDTLLKRCLVTNINVNDLITTDRFFLLLMLRANSYGDEYKINLTCTSCDKLNNYTVKIPSEFEINYSSPDDAEPFYCDLPISKLKIGYRHLRGKDEKDIKKLVETEVAKSGDKGDPSFIYRIVKRIVSVNGNKLDFLDLISLVENLPIKDSRFLQSEFDRKLPGLIPIIKRKCEYCGAAVTSSLPFTAEFFRPEF